MKDQSNFEEKQVASHEVFHGRVLDLVVDDVTLPDGRPAVREVIHHVGAVAVLPLSDDGRVFCVSQYRYPHGRVFLEIPAGKLNYAGEDPEEAARRELREETGAECEKLLPLGLFIPSPAILGERVHLYLARGLSFHAPNPDDDEFLTLSSHPLAELVEKVLAGEIADGKTQVAILKTAERLRREEDRA